MFMQYKTSCSDKAMKCSDQTSFLVNPEFCKDLQGMWKCPFKYSLMLLSEKFFAPLNLKKVIFPICRNFFEAGQTLLCFGVLSIERE